MEWVVSSIAWLREIGATVVAYFTAHPYDALFVVVALAVLLLVVRLLSGVLKVIAYLLVVIVLALGALWLARELGVWQGQAPFSGL